LPQYRSNNFGTVNDVADNVERDPDYESENDSSAPPTFSTAYRIFKMEYPSLVGKFLLELHAHQMLNQIRKRKGLLLEITNVYRGPAINGNRHQRPVGQFNTAAIGQAAGIPNSDQMSAH